jgi:cytidylate kinase
MVEIQRSISMNQSIVIDGRDIGTVVFPNADYKFFITASLEIRAIRRYEEIKTSDRTIDIATIMEQIKERDFLDSNRDNSPLKKAVDSIIIDTTDLEVDEQVSMILEIINKKN